VRAGPWPFPRSSELFGKAMGRKRDGGCSRKRSMEVSKCERDRQGEKERQAAGECFDHVMCRERYQVSCVHACMIQKLITEANQHAILQTPKFELSSRL